MLHLAVIDRVGGLANYLLLQEDARLFDLVMVAMQGEGIASKEAQVEAAAKARAAAARAKRR